MNIFSWREDDRAWEGREALWDPGYGFCRLALVDTTRALAGQWYWGGWEETAIAAAGILKLATASVLCTPGQSAQNCDSARQQSPPM